jgi:hypothetical protein
VSATCQSVETKNTYISDTYGQATLVASKGVNRNSKCINFTLKSFDIIFEHLKFFSWSLPSDIQLAIPVIQHWMRRYCRKVTGSIYSLLTWLAAEIQKVTRSPRYTVPNQVLPECKWQPVTKQLWPFICVLKLANSLILLHWKFAFPSFVLWIIKLRELFTRLSARQSVMILLLCAGSLFIYNVMFQYLSHLP